MHAIRSCLLLKPITIHQLKLAVSLPWIYAGFPQERDRLLTDNGRLKEEYDRIRFAALPWLLLYSTE